MAMSPCGFCLFFLCELAKATGGRVLLLNRGGGERQRLYFQIGEDIEMIIMQVRPPSWSLHTG
jgi:cytidine deaminase